MEISATLVKELREKTGVGMNRLKLKRDIAVINSPWGKIKVKEINNNGDIHLAPEYEECRRIALEKKMPIKKIYEWIASRNK